MQCRQEGEKGASALERVWGAHKMAQLEKVLVAKPNKLSSIPGTHTQRI